MTLNLLDWLWNLPPLPALALLDTPFAVAIVWLVWRVRKTVNRSGRLMNSLPNFTDYELSVLSWSARKAVANEARLYELARKRGER